MARVKGSLMEAMWEDFVKGGEKVGILLIDEQHQVDQKNPNLEVKIPKSMANLRYQQTLLAYAQYLGCPMWYVESDAPTVMGQPQPELPTTERLRGLLPPKTPLIKKPYYNAFEGTDLEAQMTKAKLEAVVVLGYETNFCVKFTAIGGSRSKEGKTAFVSGAVQRGWPVLTCQKILNGLTDALWQDEEGVCFYDRL